MPTGDEALAWLGQLAAGKEEELRAQAQAEAELRMAEVMGRPAPAEAPPVEAAPEEVAPPVEQAAPTPVEEPFGWTPFEQPQVPSEAIAAAEEAPPVEEPFGWTPFEEPQAPSEAIAAMEEAPPEAPLELEEEGILPPPVVEEVPGLPEMEVPAAPPEPLPAAAPAEPFAAERAYLKANPRDYEGWLALARALWQAGQREEALEAYSRLIRPGRLLDGVIADLEGYARQRPDVSVQRVLGDAYMKVGRLQEALSLYRRALETL
jgi:tetratricopeptide (TPR) repeat protein